MNNYISPTPLSLLNEECFYFHNDKWIIGTYQNGNNWCSIHSGYIKIMGPIHPLLNSQHTTEVNYYPYLFHCYLIVGYLNKKKNLML